MLRWTTFSSLVQHGRDAEDEVSADVGHWRLDDTLAVLQAPITLKSLPGDVCAGVPTFRACEYLQVLTVRDQHNLRPRKHSTLRVCKNQQVRNEFKPRNKHFSLPFSLSGRQRVCRLWFWLI